MAGLTQQTSSEDAFFGKEAGLSSGKSERADCSAGASPLCPQCGSKKVWRDALRYSSFGDKIQRWLCRDCGVRFSDPIDVKNAWSTREKATKFSSDNEIKASDDLVSTRQICVKETKNLVAEQQTTEVLRRNETADAKGRIVEYSFWLLKEGYAKSTI